MALTIGQTIQSRYQIQSILGHGGMGVVYLAYDPVLQRSVAIKVLPPQLTIDAEFVTRFQREAIASANLRDPHIVTVYDVGQQDGEYFIIMEYLEGSTLEQWLADNGPMSLAQVSKVINQIAGALDHAHSRGIVHRDIKPSNIMLGPDDHAVLMDFGLVRAGEGFGPTRSTTVMGTPEYMAPEQVLGQSIDRRTDNYALGVVLFELLCGRTPFAHTTPLATAHAHAYEAPPPLRTVNKALPKPVEAVVMKALAKDPGTRYQSAGDLARDFSQAVSGVMPAGFAAQLAAEAGAGATNPSSSSAGGMETVAMLPRAGGTAPTPARQPRSRRSAFLVPGVLVVIAVLLAVLLWPRSGTFGDSPTPNPPAVVVAATATSTPTQLARLASSTDPPAVALPVFAVEPITPTASVDKPTPTVTQRAVPTHSPTATSLPKVMPTATSAPTSTPTLAATVTPYVATSAFIRSCPSTDCSEVRRAASESTIPAVCLVTEADGAWYKLANNQGWVRFDVATLSGKLRPCPIAGVTPTPRTAAASSGSSSSSSGASCRTAASLPAVTLGAPAVDKTCNGPVRFTWQAPYALQAGEVFEVHIWADRNQNRGNVKQVKDTFAVVDLRKDVLWIEWNDNNRAHYWEIVVVCQSTGTWLSQAPRAHLFYFEPRMPVDENNPDNNCR